MFVPYHGEPGEAVTKEPFAAFGGGASQWDSSGAGSFMPRWAGTANADWVLGPVGPGAKGNTSIAVGQGLQITETGAAFRIRGNRRPTAMALLFEYDGLDLGDQRALISQDGFRSRIQTDANPHGFGSDSVAIADCIWDNELTLLVIWSDTRVSTGEDYATLVFNLDEHPGVRGLAFDVDLFGEGQPSSPMLAAAEEANDPSEGITVYGFWAWGGMGNDPAGDGGENRHWTTQRAEKFAEDPFGMYRRAAVLTSPIAQVGTPQFGEGENGNDVTLTFDTPLLEDDVVIVVGGHGNDDGVDPIGPSTAGYTTENDTDDGADDWTGGVWWKVMGSTPDTTVVCLNGNTVRDAAAYAAYALRGVDTNTVMDVAAVLSARVTTNDTDPDSITTVTDGAWVIAAAIVRNDNLATAFPVGYTNSGAIGRDETNPQSIHTAVMEVKELGTENPPAFTIANAGATNAAFTIAVRPFTSPITQVGTIQEVGVINSAVPTLTFDGVLQEDDLVVVIGSIGNALGNGPLGPEVAASYTERAHETRGTQLPNIGMWTKLMGATPDTDVDMQTEHSNDGVVYQSIVLRGVDTTTPMDAAPVITSTATADDPDLDPITVATQGAWVILGFGGSPDGSDMTAFPTGYVGEHESINETNFGNIAIAVKETLPPGAENPDAATAAWGTGHASITAAFRPAGGAAPATDSILPHFASMIAA